MSCGIFHSSYRTDERIFQTTWIRLWLISFAIFLILVPWLFDDYAIYLFNVILIFVVGAVGLNILVGFTGQISIGHGAFIAVGAYTSGLLASKLGVPLPVAVIMAGLVSSAVGMIFGVPSLRVKGLYLVIATLSAQLIIEWIIIHWDSLTNGITGIFIPAPSLFGIVFDDDRKFYFLNLVFATGAVTAGRNLFRTKVGRAFIAIRDRDIAAELVGINVFKYKLLAFGISSFFAGVTGCLWANFMTSITPEHFTITLSIDYLAMVIVGGLGSILGSIFGVIFLSMLPELLNSIALSLKGTMESALTLLPMINGIVYGVVIILFLVFEPEGLAELWRRLKMYFKQWPYSY